MKKGTLFILSGPSGVGKGTVRKVLFDQYQDSLDLHYSISMTTREKRKGEEEGVDYYYVTPEEFARRVANDEFLEHATFVSASYGTPKDKVEELLDAGKNVMLEIEVQGALQVMEKMPEAISIFLLPPSLEELEARIRGRGTETEEKIQSRLKQAASELATQDRYTYRVVNDEIAHAVMKIADILKQYI